MTVAQAPEPPLITWRTSRHHGGLVACILTAKGSRVLAVIRNSNTRRVTLKPEKSWIYHPLGFKAELMFPAIAGRDKVKGLETENQARQWIEAQVKDFLEDLTSPVQCA